jgi:ATP-dependent DNA helicase RecQ
MASTQSLKQVLAETFGIEDFRPGQKELVQAILEGRDALAIMPTGSGKSLIYQLPAVMLDGLTVVVSPLIALMKDQTDKLESLNVDVVTIHSGLTDREQRNAETAIAEGKGAILYVTPPAPQRPGSAATSSPCCSTTRRRRPPSRTPAPGCWTGSASR